jgi:hypothetical protein
MGRTHFTSERRTRFEKTDPRWLRVGSQLNELANDWASRDDIVTFVGEGAGSGAPACFVPDISEMEVDVKVAFGDGADPDWMDDLTERDVQFDHPVAMGAVLHEAMHAKHSTWDLRDCMKGVKDRFEHDLVTSFEETRIEARGVSRFPENKPFLRACALKLVVGDLKEDKQFAERGHQSMSRLMLLTLARVDAGVLKPQDVEPIREAADKAYGPVVMEKLRAIWVAAQAHAQDDRWEPLHELAKKWVEVLEDAGHDPKAESEIPEWLKELLQAMVGVGSGGDASDGDDEGSGSGGGGKPGEEDGEDGESSGGMLEEMADDAETAAREDATEQALAEQAAERAAEQNARSQEKASHEKQAAKTFGRGTGPGPANTASHLIEKRDPAGKERAAAVALAKDLEKARYRDRVVEKKTSAVPPGRLKMRSAMAGDVSRSRGMQSDVEPWHGKRRHHTEDPELKVGVLVDISGSMRRAMQPMAATAWVLSEAVKRVQGKAAMVYYGNDVFPVLAPGQHLDKVTVYSASDMTEKFDRGFKALNGKMDLLGSAGARLLVVVSDLYHNHDEIEAATEWFKRCKRDGVAVVVVAPSEDQRRRCERILGANGTAITIDLTDAGATARQIGAAAVRELQRASR